MALVKRKGITISRQLMDDQRLFPEATGALTAGEERVQRCC